MHRPAHRVRTRRSDWAAGCSLRSYVASRVRRTTSRGHVFVRIAISSALIALRVSRTLWATGSDVKSNNAFVRSIGHHVFSCLEGKRPNASVKAAPREYSHDRWLFERSSTKIMEAGTASDGRSSRNLWRTVTRRTIIQPSSPSYCVFACSSCARVGKSQKTAYARRLSKHFKASEVARTSVNEGCVWLGGSWFASFITSSQTRGSRVGMFTRRAIVG